jgi:Fur family ferric uptake transcriptional regulator
MITDVKSHAKSKCEHSKEGGLILSALESLRKKGLKVTSARKLILEYLTKAHGPFTIEEIHAGMRSKNCDLVTVYRTLDTLEKLGLVRKYEIGDRVARFEFQCAEHPHHHLICKDCKKVEVLNTDLLSEVKKLASKRGFAKIMPSFDFFGICNNCEKQKAPAFR